MHIETKIVLEGFWIKLTEEKKRRWWKLVKNFLCDIKGGLDLALYKHVSVKKAKNSLEKPVQKTHFIENKHVFPRVFDDQMILSDDMLWISFSIVSFF